MDETEKAELMREIEILANGRCMQTKLAECILKIARRANTLTEIAIEQSAKGNFKEADPIMAEVMGYSEALLQSAKLREVFPGCNAKR